MSLSVLSAGTGIVYCNSVANMVLKRCFISKKFVPLNVRIKH